jgi:hypothetical protein
MQARDRKLYLYDTFAWTWEAASDPTVYDGADTPPVDVRNPASGTLTAGISCAEVARNVASCGVPPERIVALDGDYSIGGGFAIVRTPGHTWGNQSLVVVTGTGAWTISENGICVDAYAPGVSRIRGVARHAREAGVEVILNANTREGTLDQYTSMVLEKTLADGVPERPELPQHFSSSELVPHLLAPGLAPTYTHGAITHGEIAVRAAVAA